MEIFLNIGIYAFIVLELLNVIILYYFPNLNYGNSMSIFKEWTNSQNDKFTYLFHKYMKNWVAGSKLIFIGLLLVIVLLGSIEVKMYSILALILMISTYYFKLHPILKQLDNVNQLEPKGYSRTLFIMITSFITSFIVLFIAFWFTQI